MAGKTSTSQAKASAAAPSRGSVISALILTGLIVTAVSGWAWWHYVRSNPQRVFGAMLENNLRTKGVSNRIEQRATGQSLDQTVQLTTGPAHGVHAETKLSQDGDNTSTVKTEIIGTPYEEFVRYTDIQTTQKREDGGELDFSGIKNIWGRTGPEAGAKSEPTGDLYNQSVLDVVPFANIPAQARGQILALIREKNVYEVDYARMERTIRNGRPVYTYPVFLRPEPYVTMLKELGRNIGLTQLANVDPSVYKDSEKIQFIFEVDVWTRQLTKISYPGGARTETLSAFGIKRSENLPQQSIPVGDLQSKLQSIK